MAEAAGAMAGAAAGAGAAAASRLTDLVCGVLQIGPAQVALPLEVLREVIPCPDVLDGLPAAAPGLLGAVRLRGRVVPVLDLRVVLGQPAPRVPGQVVVLMRHAGRLLGVLADSVCGLVTLARGQLGVMAAHGSTGGQLLFSGSFERTADGSAVSLLDPAAVMALPGLPLLADAPSATAGHPSGAREAGQGELRPLLLVRCGSIGLAIEVTDVHATLPTVTLLPSSLDGALCRGVIEHAGVRLPAVDALVLLGLGALGPDEPCQALLLQFGGGQVALLVSRVVDIVHVPVADLAPLAPLAVRCPAFFAAGMRVAGHGEQLLLARGALRESPQLVALASLNTRAGVAGPGAAGVRRAAAAALPGSAEPAAPGGIDVITYDVGFEAATPLAQVIEVLRFPPDPVCAERAHPAAVGTFTHRGRGVTLLCLQTLLGTGAPVAAPDVGTARVLLVELDGARLGFVVPALSHIDRALWERRPAASRGPDSAGGPARPASMAGQGLVEVQGNGHRRTLRLVDLQALARSLMPASTEVAQVVEVVETPETPEVLGMPGVPAVQADLPPGDEAAARPAQLALA